MEPQDRSILDAAKRECVEETGLVLDDSFTAQLVSVDVHEIPAHGEQPVHSHHDMMFVLVAATETFGEDPLRHQATWVKPQDSDKHAIDGGTRRGLAGAKDYMKGSLTLSLESTSSRMSNLARQERYFQRFASIEEVHEKIEQVDAAVIQQVAEEWFRPEKIALAVLGNLNGFKIGRDELRC